MENKIYRVLFAVFFLLLFGLAVTRVFDWDIFWQLQSGKYIWQTQSMIRFDTFTLAAETPRWEHCWLHDLVYYAVWSAGGFAAMSLLKGALVTATAAILAVVAWRRSASLPALLLVLPVTMFYTYNYWCDRPQLWSYLGLALLLWLLEDFQTKRGRRVFLSVPLMVCWANLHGGVLIVFPVLLAYCVAAVAENWRRGKQLRSGGVGTLCLLFPLLFAALLFTPYGSEFISVLVSAAQGAALGAASGSAAMTMNFDWLPWSLAAHPAYLVAVIVSGLLLLLAHASVRLRDLLLLCGLAFMGFRLQRHIPFFFLAMAALLPFYVAAIGRQLMSRWPRSRGTLPRYALILLTLLLLLLPARMVGRSYGFFDVGLRDWHFPVTATEFLRAEKLPGRIFNAYEWGGYLEWQLYPDYRVYWDARQSNVDYFVEGMRLVDGDPAWETILARHAIDVIVVAPVHYAGGVRRSHFLDPLRADTDWALVFAGGPALVFVRTAAVDAAWLDEHRLPESRIDDVSLELTGKQLELYPHFYRAHGERARIFLARGDLIGTLRELERYMELCPPDLRDAGAVRVYQALHKRQK